MAAYEPPDFYEFEVSPDLYGPTTAPPSNASIPPPIYNVALNSFLPRAGSNVDTPVEHLKTALVAAAVVSFIFLIAKDAHKAFTRRAHWIPCDFLVLSAFSIQMLNMLNIQNEAATGTSPQRNQTMMAAFSKTARWISIKEGISNGATGGGQSARWKDFLMIHNSRTILCVFTAYVMPSMADPGLEYAWVRWVALLITVFHHVTSQFYSLKGKSVDHSSDSPSLIRIWPEPNGGRTAPYYVYATIISLCFVLLILLLASATIAGRSIERIVAQQIPLVLRGERELYNQDVQPAEKKDEDVHPAEKKEQDVHPAEKTEIVSEVEKTEGVHRDHYPIFRNVRFDVNRADQHYHLHHRSQSGEDDSHNYHSCGQISEEGAARGEEEERSRRHCHYCWRRVEDAVLKAWIIVRAYSVQPVIARSALSASAAVIVTIQISITIAGGLSKVLKKENGGKINTFQLVALVVQSLFILMAWALINLRWGIAAAYQQKHDSWCDALKVEDFWTRHLTELAQKDGESKLEESQTLDNEINQLVSTKKTTVPSLLLHFAIGLQLLLVKLSKACWLVSLMFFHNKFMDYLFKCLFETYILCVFEDYPKYKKMLAEVQMLGESPESLWVSNRKSIQEARGLSIQGNQDAELNCEDLVDFLLTKGIAQPPTDLNFMWKNKSIQREEKNGAGEQQSRGRGNDPSPVERRFSEDTAKSWKMKAVSLLAILVHLSAFNVKVDKEQSSTSTKAGKKQSSTSTKVDKKQSSTSTEDKKDCPVFCAFPPKDVKKCLDVYSQAWEIIDFVDEAEAETEADRISSEAADKYFHALKEWVPKEYIPLENFNCQTIEWVRAALDKLKNETSELKHLNAPNKDFQQEKLEKHKKVTSKPKQAKLPNIICKGNDSIDWKAVASGGAVYNLCKSIERDYGGREVTDLQKELESSLAYIIRECLEKTQNLLLVKSRKWALHKDEKRMGKALYAAGKAKVIMEKLASNKLAIVYYH